MLYKHFYNYMAMAATRTEVEPENMLPTETTTYYHALRVHLQVVQWEHLDLKCLNPLDCSWTFQNNSVIPVKTDFPAAPDWLLQVVRCKCKTTTKRSCSVLICSCRQNVVRMDLLVYLLVAIVIGKIARTWQSSSMKKTHKRMEVGVFFICLIQTNTLYKNITKFLCFIDFA